MPKIHKIDRRAVNLDPAQIKAMLADPRVSGRGRPPAPRPGPGPSDPSRRPDIGLGHGLGPIPVPRWAIALSGGGAKGSFQVGALKYLYEERRIRPRTIVGTSVGSVNGVKLAEGQTGTSATAGHVTGFAGLERSWLDIEGEADMYVEKKVFRDLKALAGRADEIGYEIVAGIALPGIGTAIGIGTDVGLTLKDAKELFEKFLYIDGLVSLSPVVAKLRDPAYLDGELVRNSGVDFRTVWVGMLSGEAYCVDNQRRLYRLSEPTAPIGSVSELTTAVHASAAQPFFMESPIVEGEIGNKKFKEKGFDGGVREIVGVKCAIQLGATEIVAIMCQPLDPGLASIFEQPFPETSMVPGFKPPPGAKMFNATARRYKSILTLAERGLGLALDEVLENDLAAAGDADVHVVRPYIEVHDGMTLIPSLIRVNMSHGWMCAFDTFHDNTTGPLNFLVGGNLLITENRMWKAKLQIARQMPWADRAKIDAAIADCNARISQGLALRTAIDPESLPADAATWND